MRNIRNSLKSLLQRHPHFTVEKFLDGRVHIDGELFEDLYAFYLCEMPYGTAKARDGDPYQWIYNRLEEEFKDDDAPVGI